MDYTDTDTHTHHFTASRITLHNLSFSIRKEDNRWLVTVMLIGFPLLGSQGLEEETAGEVERRKEWKIEKDRIVLPYIIYSTRTKLTPLTYMTRLCSALLPAFILILFSFLSNVCSVEGFKSFQHNLSVFLFILSQ